MKGIKQPSLLDLGEPKIDLDFPGIGRIDLGEGAWVEHLPNWLKGHQDLFETLRETTGWRRQERQMYDQVIEVPRLRFLIWANRKLIWIFPESYALIWAKEPGWNTFRRGIKTCLKPCVKRRLAQTSG